MLLQSFKIYIQKCLNSNQNKLSYFLASEFFASGGDWKMGFTQQDRSLVDKSVATYDSSRLAAVYNWEWFNWQCTICYLIQKP